MTQPRSTLNDFDSFEQIGRGSFGVVFKVRRRADNRIYALKQVALNSPQQYTETVKEINILASINHNHVVRYYDCFSSDNNTKLNIVMEYAKHGTLHDMIKARNGQFLAEADIWRYFYHMLLALHYIHQKKILHRDIKAMNVFLDEKLDCKLGDFGVSKILDRPQDLTQTIIGTPLYMSPELCKNVAYDARSDIWALGCILYEMCTLVHPFEHAIVDYIRNPMALAQAVMNGTWDRNIIKKSYSSEMLAIIEQCLAIEPYRRPTAVQLLESPLVLNRLMYHSIIPNKTVEKKEEWVLVDQDKVVTPTSTPPTPFQQPQQQLNGTPQTPVQQQPISHLPMQPARITPIPAPQRPPQPQPQQQHNYQYNQQHQQQQQHYQYNNQQQLPHYPVQQQRQQQQQLQPVQLPHYPQQHQNSPQVHHYQQQQQPYYQPQPQQQQVYPQQQQIQYPRITPQQYIPPPQPQQPQVYPQQQPQQQQPIQQPQQQPNVNSRTEQCPVCKGSKVSDNRKCGACNGEGFIYL